MSSRQDKFYPWSMGVVYASVSVGNSIGEYFLIRSASLLLISCSTGRFAKAEDIISKLRSTCSIGFSFFAMTVSMSVSSKQLMMRRLYEAQRHLMKSNPIYSMRPKDLLLYFFFLLLMKGL